MTILKPDQNYLAYLAQGKFMLQKSLSTGRHVFYPRIAVPGSGETDLAWVEASGQGTVHATTIVRQRPPAADYNVALIDLQEGVRMMSSVRGIAPDKVTIGMAVVARIDTEDGAPLVVFSPANTPNT